MLLRRALRGIFFFVAMSTYVTVTFAAHPCENNISAALRIPLCRLYGLTEVGYRVLVPGPDPTRACILLPPLSRNTRDKHSVQPPRIYRKFGNRSNPLHNELYVNSIKVRIIFLK